MPKTSNELTVQLDADSVELLLQLETLTGLPPGATLSRLFPSHLEELWEYRHWLESLPPGAVAQRELGSMLLQSYGPSSLIEDIKRIDPSFMPLAQKFVDGLEDQVVTER